MTHPIPFGELLDYWLDDLAPELAEQIEEHLFACSECVTRLEQVSSIGADIAGLIRRGLLSARGSGALLNRFSRDKINVRQYTLYPGDVVACTVSPSDDFLSARLALGAPPPDRVDLSVRGPEGQELMRIEDVIVDPRANQVISFVSARHEQGAASSRFQYVLLAVEPTGEQVIGTYTLEHTAMREA